MNRRQLVALADAIAAVRPDWNQPGILAALSRLEQNWTSTDAALAAHAMAVAAQPGAQTPVAINLGPLPTPTAAPTPTHSFGRQEQCYICGRTRPQCEAVHAKEIARGIPDPHEFETLDHAEANKARHQIDARARAQADIAEARRKVAYQPEQLPEPRRIQEPIPEQQEAPA